MRNEDRIPFRKRYLSSPLEVLRHALRANISLFKMVFAGKESRISHAFRERLNLAVCGVNECVYCTHLHTKVALAAGVTGDQAAALLAGETEGLPVEEVKALAFARYWADSGGWNDTDKYGSLVETYGSRKAVTILSTLHIIQAGNMCSNTAEAFRQKVDARGGVAFFFAWLLAAPVAFFVKLAGGYRER